MLEDVLKSKNVVRYRNTCTINKKLWSIIKTVKSTVFHGSELHIVHQGKTYRMETYRYRSGI